MDNKDDSLGGTSWYISCDKCGKEVTGNVYGISNVNIDYSWCDVAEEVSRFIHPDCYYEYKENNNA